MTKSKNVYYNKQDEHGNGKYRTGQFPSAKNKSSYIYRSSYEYAFFTKLESVKLAKLLAANEVVVASDDGAPCCHQAVCLMVMLQMK